MIDELKMMKNIKRELRRLNMLKQKHDSEIKLKKIKNQSRWSIGIALLTILCQHFETYCLREFCIFWKIIPLPSWFINNLNLILIGFSKRLVTTIPDVVENIKIELFSLHNLFQYLSKLFTFWNILSEGILDLLKDNSAPGLVQKQLDLIVIDSM